MKTRTLLLGGAALAAVGYLILRPKAAGAATSAATTPVPAPATHVPPVVLTTTTVPGGVPGGHAALPPYTDTTAKEIARLLSPNVFEIDPNIYERYAQIAAGPDGAQNAALVSQLHAKAYVTRLAALYAHGGKFWP